MGEVLARHLSVATSTDVSTSPPSSGMRAGFAVDLGNCGGGLHRHSLAPMSPATAPVVRD
jgi:hypothetical protein